MAAGVDLILLHDGPHDSVGDLTFSDYAFIALLVLALVGVGVGLWHVIKRRREDGP